jgi:hypothetical protein
MKIDLKELEALARAATPGPWLHRHDPGNPVGCQHGVKLPGELGAWIGDCIDNADRSTEGGVAGERNAAFIAAANPAAVLELIALASAPAAPVTPKHIEEIKDILLWPVTEDDARVARDMLQSLHFDLSMAQEPTTPGGSRYIAEPNAFQTKLLHAMYRAAQSGESIERMHFDVCAVIDAQKAADSRVTGNAQAALSDDVPPLPDLDTLADMERLFNTPAEWDADYLSIWQKLQVAERNKMQWRVYALKLRATLAATTAELEEWRFTNKVDELQRENDRLRAALAKDQEQMLRIATCAGEFAKDACKTDGERDAARLDLLEQMGNEPEGLLLHDGGDFTGRRGLGLRRIGRTLRQAVDGMLVQQDKKGGA